MAVQQGQTREFAHLVRSYQGRIFHLAHVSRPAGLMVISSCFIKGPSAARHGSPEEIESSPMKYDRSGFTLIEIIAVLVVLGILSAVVVQRATFTDARVAAQIEVVKTHLRYAQERAMNTNEIWYIQFTGTSYTLYRGGTAMTLPGESGVVVNPGVTLSWTGGTNVFSFDNRGRPCTDTAGAALLAAARTVTLTHGSETATITVTPNTGFIP
jgi:MSHA pilin protein MshC